jgi:hypothetical protein
VVTDEPLHVRVAEALGCSPRLIVAYSRVHGETTPDEWACGCAGRAHSDPGNPAGAGHDCEYPMVYYDTSWSATGPLIEKYEIAVLPPERIAGGCLLWGARPYVGGPMEFGPSPLIAVCNLLLALAEAGRLER